MRHRRILTGGTYSATWKRGNVMDKKFWVQAGERALKTFAQSFIAVAGTGAVLPADMPWVAAFTAALVAAFISILTSMATVNIGPDKGTPSMVATEASDLREQIKACREEMQTLRAAVRSPSLNQ
jgi:hypothetical protein